MRQCYENYGLHSGQAKRLKKHVLETFTEEKIYDSLIEKILGYNVNEFEDWMSQLEEVEAM